MRWRPLKAGEIFEGRYRIEAALGSGGFSYVYRATQVELGRQVALKVLRPFLHTSDMDTHERDQGRFEWVERFRREAQVVSRLRDPHTITMYEYGQTAGGMSFMAFEYINGHSLSHIIRQESPIDPQRLGLILRQCLSSLQEAHSLDMLHRDIKPANIMLFEHLGRADQIKVLDFGIAKVLSNDDEEEGFLPELTQVGAILGTPRYMSPEQLRGNAVTPASDLYSLALVAYELLTGNKAIGDTSTISVISNQLSPEPVRLPENAAVPYGLATIIHHMLHKDPAARYQAAAEVLEDLDRWLDDYRSPSEPTSLDVGPAVAAALAKPPLNVSLNGEDQDITFLRNHDVTHHPAPAAPQPNPSQPSPPQPSPPQPSPPQPSPPQPSPPPRAPEPVLNPMLAAPVASTLNEPEKPKNRWFLITAVLVILIGIAGFLVQQFLTNDHDSPIELGSATLANHDTTPDEPEPKAESKPEPEPEPTPKTAAGFMVFVTDPARAEIFINDKSIGKSPQRVESNQFDFPIFVKARMPDGRETSEAFTEPIDLFELRLPPPSAVAPGKFRTRPSTQSSAPATTNTVKTKSSKKRSSQSASKPSPKSKPKSSFPALDSL